MVGGCSCCCGSCGVSAVAVGALISGCGVSAVAVGALISVCGVSAVAVGGLKLAGGLLLLSAVRPSFTLCRILTSCCSRRVRKEQSLLGGIGCYPSVYKASLCSVCKASLSVRVHCLAVLCVHVRCSDMLTLLVSQGHQNYSPLLIGVAGWCTQLWTFCMGGTVSSA